MVSSKYSQSKIFYWYARTLAKLKRFDDAKEYYQKGSNYLSTFYGQLSAERINKNPLNLSLITNRKFDCTKVDILKNPIINLGKKLFDTDLSLIHISEPTRPY